MILALVSSFRVRLVALGLWSPIRNGAWVAIVVAIGSIFLPNYYRSEARILPVESRGSGTGGNLVAAAQAFGVSLQGQEPGDSNFVEIIGSRWLRERLLQSEFQFKERDWRFGAEVSKKQTLLEYTNASNLDRGVGALGGILSASRDFKTRILYISAETKSPSLSRMVVARTLELLETFIQEKGRTRGGAKALFAEARLGDARAELSHAQEILREFLNINRNFQSSNDPFIRLKGSALESELRLRQQLVATLAMSREQALMEEKNDIPILNLMDHPNLPFEKSAPTRSNMVLGAFFLVSLASWTWGQREWLKTLLSLG